MDPVRRVFAGYTTVPEALWLWALSLLTFLAVVMVLFDFDSPLRVAVVLGFMLGAPGVALARAIGIEGVVGTLVVGIATSIAANIILAGSLIYIDIWHPTGILLGLAAATSLLIAVAAARTSSTSAEPVAA